MWLDIQRERIKDDLNSRLATVFEHSHYIMGPEISNLEYELSRYVGTKYAVGCSSGTDALLMSLMAHGVGPGYMIFTTPFTFISTAEVVSLLGADIHFVDIDPVTFNIDPIALEQRMNTLRADRCKCGIIAVDLFGLPADYVLIKQIADMYNAFVIEDAAQSMGADINGYRAGSLSEIGCTSFFPTKPLGCYGDGGMCFTNNEKIYQELQSIRVHGKGSDKYDNRRIGINGRLDTIQAAILLSKLKIFEDEVEKRQVVAKRYDELLNGCNVKIPYIPDMLKSAWAQYSIRFENEDTRNLMSNKLKNEGIDTAIYYPKPLHLQDAFRDCYYNEGDFPISESCSKTILSLPMHPYLTKKEQIKIAEVIHENVAV